MTRHPVDASYEDCLHICCPNCYALPGDYCVNRRTRKPSKIPCKDRLVEGDRQSTLPVD